MGLKEIIPLLAAVIGLTPVILKWLNDRSTEAANRRLIQQAKEQVEFWQVWLQAQREVTTDERFALLKNEISQRLDNLLEKNIEQENKEKIKKHESESHSFFQKIFLLYLPHTTSGWIFHTLFYITVSFTFMLLFGLSIPPDDINANPSWEYFKNEIGMNITIFLFFVVIAFIFQRFASSIERRQNKKITVPEK
jgi:hypothetical protein